MVSMHRRMNTQSLRSNSEHTWHRRAWRFYTGKQFTADYRNRVETVEPFISGWLNEKQQTSRGRAVDVINLPDGSILVADDYADAIYRITYN